MENVNSAALTCRAEAVPVTEAQPGTGEGRAAPPPPGIRILPRILSGTGGTPAPTATSTVLFGGCLGGCWSGEGGTFLALAEGGEGAWLPKPDGLDAELLNYEY